MKAFLDRLSGLLSRRQAGQAGERYFCPRCSKYHEGPPLHYGAPAPAAWYAVPEKERRRRCLLSFDQCEIDGEQFFLMGNIDIPIIGDERRFSWDVWVSLSEAHYRRACGLWHTPGREAEPPYPGTLATDLYVYPDTLGLDVMAHTRPVGVRPSVEVRAPDHPLAREQREGITWEQIVELAEILLHGAQQ